MEKRLKEKYPSVADMSPAEQTGLVREMFSTIARRYDLLNHVFSMGRDLAWRRYAVKKMNFFRTKRYLDVATGTADLAIEATRSHGDIHVMGLDFVRDMMTIGADKIARQNLNRRIHLIQGDALCLPFRDGLFDVAGIAFGIRNIPDRMQALREMARAVVPGGQIMVLEMHFPQIPWFKKIYERYLMKIIPGSARLLSKNPAAYNYLADSIAHFPTPAAFAGMMKDAGLENVETHSLSLGITYLHVGIKPATAVTSARSQS